jgi:hypothetical protein
MMDGSSLLFSSNVRVWSFRLPARAISRAERNQWESGIGVVQRLDGSVAVLGLRFGGSAFTSIPTSAPFAAIAPLIWSFKSGKYSGPGTLLNGKAVVTVAGPGVADNGATEWS